MNNNCPLENFGPIKGESDFAKRMRVHQQWRGWLRLRRSMRQERPRQPYPVLTQAEQERPETSNFIGDTIYAVAQATPGLKNDKHFHHLLSSMPMAINLFGILLNPDERMVAKTDLNSILCDRIDTPFAPSPRASELVGILLGRLVVTTGRPTSGSAAWVSVL